MFFVQPSELKLTKRFAVNLTKLREARQMSKSDLAREIFGTEVDKRGYTVARNRDRIGAWESEKARPTPENIVLLAEYFQLEPADLAPDLVGRHASKQPESMSFRVLESNPGQAHVQINTILPVDVAAQIVALVSKSQVGPGPTTGGS